MINYEKIGRFLAEQLVLYRPNFFDVDTGEFWGLNPNRNFINRNPDLPLGLEEIGFFTRQSFGSAAIYDGKGSDIPIVSHTTKVGKVPTAILINGAEWNTFELATEEVANNAGLGMPRQNLTAINYVNMADFINRREHSIILYGLPNRGLYGLFNQPTVSSIDYAVANIYDPVAVPPIMLYRIFIQWIQIFMSTALITDSSMIEMKIPERLKLRLTEPYSDDAPTMTVMELLQNPVKGYAIGEITSSTEQEGHNLSTNIENFPANRDRIIMKSSGDALEQDYYARNNSQEVLVNPITYQVVGFSALSSVYAIRSNRVMYIDFINQ